MTIYNENFATAAIKWNPKKRQHLVHKRTRTNHNNNLGDEGGRNNTSSLQRK